MLEVRTDPRIVSVTFQNDSSTWICVPCPLSHSLGDAFRHVPSCVANASRSGSDCISGSMLFQELHLLYLMDSSRVGAVLWL